MAFLGNIISNALNLHQVLSGEPEGVSYFIPATSTVVELPNATKSRKPRFLQREKLTELDVEVVDWIIQADLLEDVTIEEGDSIHHENGQFSAVYRVSRFDGEPPWRYLDASETFIRIHTVLSHAEVIT